MYRYVVCVFRDDEAIFFVIRRIRPGQPGLAVAAALCYNRRVTSFAFICAGESMEIITEYVAGTPIRLKRPFDFNFLSRYGEVFKVIDNFYGSGNICFGTVQGGKKYFVKFAGAPKEKFESGAEQAIGWLKDARRAYEDLSHESLIQLVNSEEAGEGYVNVFEWIDADCIGYPNPPARRKFLALPAAKKKRAFDTILNFHAHVAAKRYVAVDFYADQILYDFVNDKTIICDIDFYQKSPYYGDKGTWGSDNFVSPEERVPGLKMDEITMVYTMGATAFSIFADYDRSPGGWGLGEAPYRTAIKAVSDDRGARQQSIDQFIREWDASLGRGDI